MWWDSGRKNIAFVDRCTVGVAAAGKRFVSVSACEEGSEFELLASAVAEVQASSWQLLLGPSLAEWRAVQRVASIWRRHEREIASRALLASSDESAMSENDSYAIYVADPAPQSRWVAYVVANQTMPAAEGLATERKNRWRSVESLPGAVASGLEHRTGLPHVLAMICARDVAWIVKDRDTVIDCGVWRGPPEQAATAVDCRRLQLIHGIPTDRMLALQLHASSVEPVRSEELASEWRWTDTRLASLWSPLRWSSHQDQR